MLSKDFILQLLREDFILVFRCRDAWVRNEIPVVVVRGGGYHILL